MVASWADDDGMHASGQIGIGIGYTFPAADSDASAYIFTAIYLVVGSTLLSTTLVYCMEVWL
jgi:hypothetical protein